MRPPRLAHGKSGKQQINNLWPCRFINDKIHEETIMEYSTIMLMLVKEDRGKAETYVFRRHVVMYQTRNSLCSQSAICICTDRLGKHVIIQIPFSPKTPFHALFIQYQSDFALTRTYWSSGGTAGRNSRFTSSHFPKLFSFPFLCPLNSQADYRCTLDPRLPFPVPRSAFSVSRVSVTSLAASYLCVIYHSFVITVVEWHHCLHNFDFVLFSNGVE